MNASKIIPYGKHTVDEQDIESVLDVLNNRFLTQGEVVPQFEQRLAEYCQSKFAVSVNSGTSGLHIACLAAGVGEGDVVWTVPNSFVASANCARYCGADVDFVDIDPVTRNISISELSRKLEKANTENRLPKALIVVHFSGLSCDMKSIREMTQQYSVTVIEDAAHALGGRYKGKPVGCCQYSDMAVLSFHPVKSITTAEGGAVLTNDAELANKLSLFSKHGVTREPDMMTHDSHGPWYYQQVELGYNYRLSDLHAALGISQLNKLDDFISLRQRLAMRYSEELSELPLKLPAIPQGIHSAWHLYMIEVEDSDRKSVFEQLQKKGIGVKCPLHPYSHSAVL